MLTVLFLAIVEKLINLAIASDEVTQAGLAPLAGKVLRLNIATPELYLDVLFNHKRLRFEPVTTLNRLNPHGVDVHQHQRQSTQANANPSGIRHSNPDCIISVKNPAELLNLMRSAEGNLPIAGDYKILMQLKQLVGGFDPDIAGQLEPLVGKPMARQLQMLISQLKGSMRLSAKQALDDVSDWANDVAGNATPDPSQTAESNALKQQLLKLRADVEREQARLIAIKAEQARLTRGR